MAKFMPTILLTIVMLALAGAAHAGEPERYRLQIKARPGETYRDTFSLSTSKSVPEIGFESRSFSKMTIQTKVDAVQASGRMALTQKVLDFRIVQGEPGKEQIVDSSDTEQYKALLQDEELGPIVREVEKTMGTPVRTEMEPTGSVRRFDAEDRSAANVLEEVMTSGMFLLPDKPVAIHETWNSGSISMEPAMLGRSETMLTMTLRRVGNLDGEQVAYIDLKGSLISFKPDDMSGAKVEIKDYNSSGLIVLALARGRIISYSHHGSRSYNVVEKGGGMILRYGYEIMQKEVK